jgi:hypothetical protein
VIALTAEMGLLTPRKILANYGESSTIGVSFKKELVRKLLPVHANPSNCCKEDEKKLTRMLTVRKLENSKNRTLEETPTRFQG